MEPKHTSQHSTSTLSLRALLSAALILLLSLALSGTFEYLRSKDHAAQQATELSLMFGRSSAILIQPLVLADDRISLNYLFNELAAQPMINGLRLTAPDQTLIALAGQPQGRGHTLELVQGDDTIGQLTLWSNAAPFAARLQQQLYEIGLLLAGSLGITALLIGFSLKQRARVDGEGSEAPEPLEFTEVARQTLREQNRDSIPEFDFTQPAEESPEPDVAKATPAREPETQPQPEPTTPEAPREQTESQAPEDGTEAETPEQPTDQVPVDQSTAEQAHTEEPAPEPSLDELPKAEPSPRRIKLVGAEALDEPEPNTGRREPSFDTDELVSLLKPSEQDQRMPRFTPKPAGYIDTTDDSDEAMVPDLELSESDTTDDSLATLLSDPEEDSSERDNPLRLSDEEQLGLYTFEQELELMLTPEEAGYLFLIDTRSAHSDNLDEDERAVLLKNYRTLANSVARIYSGNLETLKDGNLRILFTSADDKDSHGVNAICCAMLFTYLYQHYNQQQIRAFQPVMNLHMALVRGALDKVERMQEEAHFLSRTTQSNALISHTALTEAPQLKESLLSQADIRREDEDKVLLLAVNESYQNLLEKQARHLLSKLAERSKGNAGA
ncbi:hypothetical protein H9C73_05555 [Marinobacterium sp. AK62]|uniref:GGDEF domain-containing protein n=1 Tax=Marinobacterium alkalitolerans TaxID=1542925 RepID=A0ABS3ZAX3_9GAMM|nr:hypothetical protein [Marinobacterium alkalitolerans]MBP0048194.1 hypothetical protein [Marinobacterium alkalitolerans]